VKQTAIVNIGTLVALPPGATMDPRVVAESSMQDAAMLFDEAGTVSWIGFQRDLPKAYYEAVDAQGGLVTPGLVDCHTHLVFGGNRIDECALKCAGATYAEIKAAGGGILSTMRATREATEAELLSSARIHLRRLIAGGVTSVEIKSGYGLDLENERKMLRVAGALGAEFGMVISRTLLALHAVPPEFEGRREKYVDHVVGDLLPQIATERLADAVDIFVEVGYFTLEDARSLFEVARKHGLRTQMHVDQFSHHSHAIHALSELEADTVDHLETTDPSEIAKLVNPKGIAVLLPASVIGLFQTNYANARAMIGAGWNVALSTDFNPGSSPCPSMPFVGALASRNMRMHPAEILLAMTVNAAAAMGKGHQVGALQVGSRADLVIWDCESVEELFYWMGAPLVKQVFIGGRPALA